MSLLLPEHIRPLIETRLHNLGFELFDAKFFQTGKRATLRVIADKETGVTISDCERISNELSILLDVEDFCQTRPYNLEISTPGIDRPLRNDRDFNRAKGRTVVLNMTPAFDGKKTLRGRVLSCAGGVLSVEIEGRPVDLSLAFISSGKEEIQFK